MDNITVLNYCSKAIENLEEMLTYYSMYPKSCRNIKIVIKLLEDSVKFILPNCGDLLDIDGFNQSHYDLLKLPYPLVAFEAPWKKHEQDNTLIEGEILSEKRIALAVESDHEIINKLPQFSYLSEIYKDQGGVFIISISEIKNKFLLLDSCCFLPYGKKLTFNDSEQTNLSIKAKKELSKKININPNNPFVYMESLSLLPEMTQEKERILGVDKSKVASMNDSRDEALMVLQACSVINCENVGIQDMLSNEKLNKARAKKNKPALFDYKVLGIGGESYKPLKLLSKSEIKKGKKRMHLRRGHIRRCESGITTWVKHSLVNSGENNMLEKTYQVKNQSI